MLILPITYEDFDGVLQTKTFHFNMTAAEIAELEFSKLDLKTEGFKDYLSKIIEARSGKDVMDSIKAVIEMTVGRREGDLFLKTPEITREFMFSGAYSKLFTDMIGDPEFAAKFVSGVVPKSMSAGVQQNFAENQKTETVALPTEDTRPPWIREDRPPTKKELVEMSKEQLFEVMDRDRQARARIDAAMRDAEGGESNEPKES